MSQINYATMSDEELRRYFLRHREGKMVQAYLDRLSDRPRNMITTGDDLDFDAKLQAAILSQMEVAEDNGEAVV